MSRTEQRIRLSVARGDIPASWGFSVGVPAENPHRQGLSPRVTSRACGVGRGV